MIHHPLESNCPSEITFLNLVLIDQWKTENTRISQKGSYILFCLNINIMSRLRLHEEKKTVNAFIIGSDLKRKSRILQQKFDFIENSSNY